MAGYNSTRLTVSLVLTLLLFICSSCSPQEILPNQNQSQDPGSGTSGEDIFSGYLGFVDDPIGEGVAFALLGGTETSTWEGVASGEFNGYEGGWLPVESRGYATGFAYLFPPEDDFPFFSTTLTPFQSLVHFDSEEPFQVYGHKGEDFRVIAEVRMTMFSGSPVFVGLTAIDPDHVKPRYEDTELEKGLRVQQAVTLQVFDETWTPLDLMPGISVAVNFEFSQPLSPSADFARFDPIEGLWKAMGTDCTSIDSLSYTCQLESLYPLLAVFDFPAETTATINQVLTLNGFTQGSLLYSLPSFQEGIGGGTGGQGGAIDKIEDWLRDQLDENGEIDPNDPTLKDLIDDLIKKALEEASTNRTESGKKGLIQALAVIMRAGQPGAGAPLEAELAKISEEIGEEALKEADCGEFRKVLKAAEQVLSTGGSMQLFDQLIKKAEEMTEDCDVWDGDITVSMTGVSAHPAGLPMKGGGGNWTEIHKVKIWTNVDDYVMHGESKVTHSLPAATFVQEKDCKSEIKMSGLSGQTSIFFQGTYNGYEFNISSVTPQGGATIKQHWLMTSKEDDSCVTVYKQDFSFSPYYSLLAHGVSSDSPPLNFQEILDTGAAEPSSNGRNRFGDNERISNPDPDLGLYPFHEGWVDWYFFHVQKKLPLEEEN